MARPIQTIAGGLLGFFQLKNNGLNPVEMPEVLQPVLELREWYWETNHEFANNVVTDPTAGGTTQLSMGITVPPGENWALLDYSVACSLGANQVIKAALGVNMPVTVGFVTLSDSELFVGADDALAVWRMQRQRIPILPAGSLLNMLFSRIVNPTPLNFSFSVYARFARMKV